MLVLSAVTYSVINGGVFNTKSEAKVSDGGGNYRNATWACTLCPRVGATSCGVGTDLFVYRVCKKARKPLYGCAETLTWSRVDCRSKETGKFAICQNNGSNCRK